MSTKRQAQFEEELAKIKKEIAEALQLLAEAKELIASEVLKRLTENEEVEEITLH